MTIIVAGFPNTRTQRTLMNVEAAVSEFDRPPSVEWISDPYRIKALGVRQTPCILINEKLKVAGRIPNLSEVEKWITEEMHEDVEV